MIGKQTEQHSDFTIGDQPDRPAPAVRLSRSEQGSKGFQTPRRRNGGEAEKELKPAHKWITILPWNTEEFGTPPVVAEFAYRKLLQRLVTVCAWCKDTQKVNGFWRHAEKRSATDAETAVSHGICPECAEKSYHEYRLA